MWVESWLETQMNKCTRNPAQFIVQISWSWYVSFAEKVVLKRPFISDTRKVLALHIHCSGLLRNRASGWYNSFSGKMVLKWPYPSGTGEASALHVQCWDLPGDSFWVDTTVLLGKWSLKGHSWRPQGKSWLSNFIVLIVEVSGRQRCESYTETSVARWS